MGWRQRRPGPQNPDKSGLVALGAYARNPPKCPGSCHPVQGLEPPPLGLSRQTWVRTSLRLLSLEVLM
jgi:hypothetical protein